MKQDNPFAKLGALDQKLYQETSPKSVEKSSFPENKKTRTPETQTSRTPENQNIAKREFYTKVTYRICDEAVDALGDAKSILKRQYKLKVNMEEIVETAIIEAFKDLTQKGEKSALVSIYSGNPEN